MKGGQREPFPKKLLWCTLKLMRSISTELPNPRVSATTTTRFLEGLAWASVGVNWCLYQETSGEEAPAACVMSAKAARARVRTSRLAGPLRAAWGLGWGLTKPAGPRPASRPHVTPRHPTSTSQSKPRCPSSQPHQSTHSKIKHIPTYLVPHLLSHSLLPKGQNTP